MTTTAPAAQPAPANTNATAHPPRSEVKSEMQADLEGWLAKAQHAAGDSHTITNAPGEAAWSSGFFSCLSPIDTCALTWCCPCITFGRTHHRLNKDGDLRGYSPVNGSCLGWYLSSFCCLSAIGNVLQRHDIRQRSNPQLKGDFVMDVLKAFCCSCCDLVQQDKEAAALLAKEKAVGVQPGLKQETMSYAPQQMMG